MDYYITSCLKWLKYFCDGCVLFFKDANLSFQFLIVLGVVSGFYALLIIFIGPLVFFLFHTCIVVDHSCFVFCRIGSIRFDCWFGKGLLESFNCLAGFIFQVILSQLVQPFIFFPSLCFSWPILFLLVHCFQYCHVFPFYFACIIL